ncbi:MAG: ATP-grasp domain-containing protein, partial [Pseudomonadota bacterium]
ENVPTRSIQALSEDGMIVRPGAKSLEIAQDRVIEKRFLHACGIQTAEFFPIESVSDLESGIKKFGGVGLLKTRRDGYDGKGQTRISPDVSAEAGFDSLGRRPCILEALVPFSHEISVIVARSANGAHRTFDVPRNEHVDGILKRSTVPSGLDPVSEAYATDAAIKLADALEHVGVLALECFVLEDGTVVANEFAPRVHNSGHWTVEACRSSQFTQHILAVAGWPLAPNHLLEEAEMVNLIGSDVDDLERLVPDAATLTLYGKRAARPGRKMGHWVKLGALP